MSDFKVGDVVKLKSGGPEMTVLQVYSNDATCTWFPHHTSPAPQIHNFVFEAMELVKKRVARAKRVARINGGG